MEYSQQRSVGLQYPQASLYYQFLGLLIPVAASLLDLLMDCIILITPQPLPVASSMFD
jgi:hypothetical protein